jgi:hypothetical protein
VTPQALLSIWTNLIFSSSTLPLCSSTTHFLPPRHPTLLPSIQLPGFTPDRLNNMKHLLELPNPLNLQSPQFWTFRSLNLPTRLILLKEVLQDILAYMFSSLATPQTVIKSIRNLQQNFLWHGHKQGKKWALVSWEKICKPTSLGGLGLHDPGKLNNVMGEKIWWRWLKYPKELWARLWKKKYTPQIQQEKLIRLEEKIHGLIFGMQLGKTTHSSKGMLFGKCGMANAQFWTDAWKKLPPLQTMDILHPYQNHIQGMRHLKVAYLWLNVPHQPPWHSWKLLPQDLNLPKILICNLGK